MPTRKGTTLITRPTEDGIVMAADDLAYAEQGGQAIPCRNRVQKVFAVDNILIGSAGVVFHKQCEYELENWVADFIEMQHCTPNKRPSDVAAALEEKMRRTFKAVESPNEKSGWETYLPGDRLVSYIILHRHQLELVDFNGKPTSGLIKDTVVVPFYGRAAVEFTANQPGLTLFHCHIQAHMDYGFKALFRYG